MKNLYKQFFSRAYHNLTELIYVNLFWLIIGTPFILTQIFFIQLILYPILWLILSTLFFFGLTIPSTFAMVHFIWKMLHCQKHELEWQDYFRGFKQHYFKSILWSITFVFLLLFCVWNFYFYAKGYMTVLPKFVNITFSVFWFWIVIFLLMNLIYLPVPATSQKLSLIKTYKTSILLTVIHLPKTILAVTTVLLLIIISLFSGIGIFIYLGSAPVLFISLFFMYLNNELPVPESKSDDKTQK